MLNSECIVLVCLIRIRVSISIDHEYVVSLDIGCSVLVLRIK